MPPVLGGIFLCYTEERWYISISSTGTTSCWIPAAGRSTWWTTWPTTSSPCIKEKSREEIVQELLAKYAGRPDVTAADLNQCLDDVASLEAAGKLWTPDVYENMAFDFKNRNHVIKALCLHVAHTCNLNCSYCFAAQGRYQASAPS